MNSPLSIIISREYLERVKRKSFIITTLIVPLFMVLMMVAPALMLMLSTPESNRIAVLDETGKIAGHLKNSDEITFTICDELLNVAKVNEDYDAVLVIGDKAIINPDRNIQLYFRGAPTLASEEYINNQLSRAIEDARLDSYGIDNLRQIIESIKVKDLKYPTIRIDKAEETETSSMLSFFISMMLDMILYMFIIIYGQMVMSSIIEEKGNRVLEIVVSSVKPRVLMLGKILGIGLVAITQILIWAVIVGCVSMWGLPLINAAETVANGDPEMAAALSQVSDPWYLIGLFGWMILFFIGGYLFYSGIYAAIGSSVDNIQDGSQLSTIATLPVIISIVVSMSIIQNPSSTLAFWISMIPFTSPMCMMSRLPFDVPTWELILSLTILYASFIGVIWLAAKIYRVGIFMYGKKPSLAEIIRWARYK